MNRRLLASLLCPLIVLAGASFGQTPTFTAINSGLETTFGNASKGVLDPQVVGITGIAYGSNTFLVVAASNGETVIRWATSPDGTTWTPRSQALPSGYKSSSQSRVHFQNGKFIFFATHSNAGGFGESWVYTSTDGASFTGAKMFDGLIGVVEFGSTDTRIVAAGTNGRQITSTDLVTWTNGPVVSGGGVYSHNDLAAGAGRFVTTINGFGGASYTSADGTSWTELAGKATPGGGWAEFGNGFFILLVGNDRYKSADGVNFTQVTPVTSPNTWTGPGGDLRYAGGRFTSSSYDLSAGKQGFLGSTDGISWTPLAYYPANPTVPAGTSRGYVFLDMVYGNGKYVLTALDVTQTLFTKTTQPAIFVTDAGEAPAPPSIGTQPQSTNAVIGGSASFSVAVSGAGLAYQWYFNNAAIAGATGATYTINSVAAGHAGQYKVGVTNAGGTTFSASVTLTLVTASSSGRITNLSVRSSAGTGDQSLLVGVVIGGTGVTGNKQALVRAAGPTLVDYGVTGALADPVMTIYQAGNVIASNDNWGGDTQITAIGAQLGAFGFNSASSKDAAFYSSTVPAGVYSIRVAGANNTTGVALAEIYDATASTSFSATTPRLVNVSARTQVNTGDQILIAGFVVGGSTSCKVLIRGIGPTLANYGVTGVLANPKLQLYKNGSVIAENDNWGGDAALSAAFSATGAFALDSASKDAALLVTLQPGVYSAQVSGVGNTTGVALVEVYEAP